MSSISPIIRCAAAIVLLSSAPARAEEIFAFLRPPSQMQIAPKVPRRPHWILRATISTKTRNCRHVYNDRSSPVRVGRRHLIVDTSHTLLFYVLGNSKAVRYGIGVGREGFTWSGVKSIIRKSEWPDWYPPPAMIARQPYLPRMIAGGAGDPLGARAMYIGGTEYRIHGTNDPSSIGKHISSGCVG